ncbi:MAG: hydrogenase expression/formation protein HypE [Deltaproteobacteria bacterium]
MSLKKILLSHGSGGKLTHDLIKGSILKKFNNPILRQLTDSALIGYNERLAFTTDSFVVNPLKFPGGDIGKLSVCGTVNDLVMSAAVPEYLSVAFIIEEGLDYEVLEEIAGSIAKTAKTAGVLIVTGDIKVVEKGACDKIFINTSGIGRIIANKDMSLDSVEPGDEIIITGNIAEHGLAVLAKRKELDLGFNIKSDCVALNTLLIPLLKKSDAIKFMRDPTRGGIATTLNEIVDFCGLGIAINESRIPIAAKVRAACELLGIDPLYVANEGKAILIVRRKRTEEVLSLLRKHPLGRNARQIGVIVKNPPKMVILNTALGTSRIIDMLVGESLPRIC